MPVHAPRQLAPRTLQRQPERDGTRTATPTTTEAVGIDHPPLTQRLASLDAPAASTLQARYTDQARTSPRAVQLQALQTQADTATETPATPNRTGLPDSLKSGIESLSGLSMDHVKVHYNSSQPAQLNALAYAQGSDIHVAPGQEKHLPHEAWHVVQQAQGRVKPTMQMKSGVAVNDDEGLEREADVMGGRVVNHDFDSGPLQLIESDSKVAQLTTEIKYLESKKIKYMASGITGDGIAKKINCAFENNEKDGGDKKITERAQYHGLGDGVEGKRKTDKYKRLKRDVGALLLKEADEIKREMTVGVKSVAILDPDHPVKGTSTEAFNRNNTVYTDYRYYRDGVALTACHLLNHDLGGRAVAENLFPHSPEYNGEHSRQKEEGAKHMLASLIKYRERGGEKGLFLKVETKVHKGVWEEPFKSREQFEAFEFKMDYFFCDSRGDKVENKLAEKINRSVHRDQRTVLGDWRHVETKSDAGKCYEESLSNCLKNNTDAPIDSQNGLNANTVSVSVGSGSDEIDEPIDYGDEEVGEYDMSDDSDVESVAGSLSDEEDVNPKRRKKPDEYEEENVDEDWDGVGQKIKRTKNNHDHWEDIIPGELINKLYPLHERAFRSVPSVDEQWLDVLSEACDYYRHLKKEELEINAKKMIVFDVINETYLKLRELKKR